MKLVTIYTAFNPADAHVVRSRLEASGFHAFVKNELASLAMDGYALAAGGIQVQVPEVEVTEARELIDSASEAPNE